jgi:hypothetical protein
VTVPVPGAGIPTLEEIRSWVGVSATVVSDEQLQQVTDAELDLQAARCLLPTDYPASLAQALYRRIARELAARGVPLGLLSADGEYGGVARMPGLDVEVNRLEAPYRITAIA